MNRTRPGLLPSTRYMGHLISGALEYGLPLEYVEWLRARPCVPENADASAWMPVFDEVLRRR